MRTISFGKYGAAPMNTAWQLGAGIALLVLVGVVFAPALDAGFIWDDDANVTQNPNLRSSDGLRALWLDPGSMTQYYPATYTTLWLVHALFALSPLPYHLLNLILHGLNACLLWRIGRRLGVRGAWLAAAVFAVHPIQVESVAWVTELKNLQSGSFALASVLAYLHFAERRSRPSQAGGRSAWIAYGLAQMLFVAAVLSKTVTAVLPGALAVVLAWRHGGVRRADLLPLLPFLAAIVPIGLLTVGMEAALGTNRGFAWDPSWLERCLRAASAAWFYLGRIVLPHDFTFVYPRLEIATGSLRAYLVAAAWPALLASVWALRRRIGNGLLTALLLFGGTLLPALGFLEIYYFRFADVADHWAYLACIGPISFVVGAGAALARSRGRRGLTFGIAVGAVLIAVLATQSFRYAHAFRDSETLFRDSLSKNPNSAMAHYNLAALIGARGETAEASAHYERVLELDPRDARALNNLGTLQLRSGRHSEAIALFEQAIAIEPLFIRALWNRGSTFEALGQIDRAIASYERALGVDPEAAIALLDRGEYAGANPARLHLTSLLERRGRFDAAADTLRAAIASDPLFVEAHYRLGRLLAQRGDVVAARRSLRAVLELAPEHRRAQAALRSIGRSTQSE